nr:PIN domain nuclease [Ardenticatenia bacterium]
QPQVYDSTYLALADLLGCAFWTADERLHRVVQAELPWVRLLAEFSA